MASPHQFPSSEDLSVPDGLPTDLPLDQSASRYVDRHGVFGVRVAVAREYLSEGFPSDQAPLLAENAGIGFVKYEQDGSAIFWDTLGRWKIDPWGMLWSLDWAYDGYVRAMVFTRSMAARNAAGNNDASYSIDTEMSGMDLPVVSTSTSDSVPGHPASNASVPQASTTPSTAPNATVHQSSTTNLTYGTAQVARLPALAVDGALVVVVNGTNRPAIRFSEVFARQLEDNETIPAPGQESWAMERTSRPRILFAYERTQAFIDASTTAEVAKRGSSITALTAADGRVLVNEKLIPILYSPYLPLVMHTKIGGWYMEAIMRLDPMVSTKDFLDRMPKIANGEFTTPREGGLNHRIFRSRQKMRCISWRRKGERTWAENIVINNIDAWGIADNSTERLPDLNSSEDGLMERMHDNPAPVRNVTKLEIRIKRLEVNIAYAEKYHPDAKEELEALESRLQAHVVLLRELSEADKSSDGSDGEGEEDEHDVDDEESIESDDEAREDAE